MRIKVLIFFRTKQIIVIKITGNDMKGNSPPAETNTRYEIRDFKVAKDFKGLKELYFIDKRLFTIDE